MKQIIRIAFLLSAVIIVMPSEALAQRKKQKSSKSESGFDLKKDLWYGGGFTLGFGSGYTGSFYYPGVQVSSFQVGLSPMVGYKITPWLSVGPRVEVTYQNTRVGNPAFAKYNSFLYGFGPFLRAKTNFKVFGHLEYQLLFYDEKEKITGERQTASAESAFIGVGYNDTAPRGLWGYEIYVTYDVLAPTDGPIPLGYRFGITYNF